MEVEEVQQRARTETLCVGLVEWEVHAAGWAAVPYSHTLQTKEMMANSSSLAFLKHFTYLT